MLNNRNLPPQIIPQTLARLAIYYLLPPDELIEGAKPSANRLNSLLGGLEYAYNEITPRILLGGLPTYNYPESVTMVASMSTYEEAARFSVPHNKRHVFLHIPDRTAMVPTEDALDVVMQMYHFLKDDPDGQVLIHCKQGHSRSMMICAALLMTAPLDHDLPSDLTMEEACKFIQNKRSWTHVEADKFNKANEVVHMFKQYENLPIESPELCANAMEYVATLHGKDAIRRLSDFIKFVAHTTSIKQREPEVAVHVQAFLYDILYTTDGQWYDDLLNGRHALRSHIKPGSELENRLLALTTSLQQLCEASCVRSSIKRVRSAYI